MHCFQIKLTCEPAPSVVSFLPGLALAKSTVLESMHTTSYFRLDTLQQVKEVYVKENDSIGEDEVILEFYPEEQD